MSFECVMLYTTNKKEIKKLGEKKNHWAEEDRNGVASRHEKRTMGKMGKKNDFRFI